MRCVLAAEILLFLVLSCPIAEAQNGNPYGECRGLITKMGAQDDGELTTKIMPLVRGGNWQAAMDLDFARAKEWKTVESRMWEQYIAYPSASMSYLWQAASVKTMIWVTEARGAQAAWHGLQDAAVEEAKQAANLRTLYESNLDIAAGVAATGL